jgi:hypothetical protein
MMRLDDLLGRLFYLIDEDETARLDYVDFLSRWVRLTWLDDGNRKAHKRSEPRTSEEVVNTRFPVRCVIAAFVFYLGRDPIRLVEGDGTTRTLRGYDRRLVRLHQSQKLQQLIFGDQPDELADEPILAREEKQRATDRRKHQQTRKRRHMAQGLDRVSLVNQTLHLPPSSRLTMLQVLPTRQGMTSAPVTGTKRKLPPPDESNPFRCTLSQVQEMRDHLQRLLGIGQGKQGEFTASYYLQWFRDETLRCWPVPDPIECDD